ncbi:interleukin-32 [Microcebus murinus]|uniref:interleukin-32 n=1 Tax=Microcebus murinus TaxID=30608 RepID=UPI003F6BAA37
MPKGKLWQAAGFLPLSSRNVPPPAPPSCVLKPAGAAASGPLCEEDKDYDREEKKPTLPAMCYSKLNPAACETLRDKMHQILDNSVDVILSQIAAHKQVQSSMVELEDKFTETSLEVLETDYGTDEPESPLLDQEMRAELRRRVQRPSVPEEPAAQGPSVPEEPEAQGPEWLLTLFQGMIDRMLNRWQDALSWMKKQWSAFAQKAVRLWTAICSMLERFRCSLKGCFSCFPSRSREPGQAD